ENIAGANRLGKEIAAPCPVASALEHKGEQRQLSGATRCGSVVFTGRAQTGTYAHRSLHGQCKNFARRLYNERPGRLWRGERALFFGENTEQATDVGKGWLNVVFTEMCHY